MKASLLFLIFMYASLSFAQDSSTKCIVSLYQVQNGGLDIQGRIMRGAVLLETSFITDEKYCEIAQVECEKKIKRLKIENAFCKMGG